MKKLLIRVVIALLVIIVLVVVGIGLFLGSAVKKGVETFGPQLTKVEIKLDSVSLSLLSGSGKIKGLVVGDPEGYKAPQAISVGLASVAVKPASVLSDKIVVRSIRVEAPEITFEGNPIHNNLNKILDNVNAATGGGSKPASKESVPAEKKPGKKLEVDEFVITGAKVHVSTTLTVPLPDIHLTDLGTGPDGITAADLTKQVLNEVVTATIKAVASAATDVGKGASSLTKQAGRTATDTAGKATKSITDLFKKNP